MQFGKTNDPITLDRKVGEALTTEWIVDLFENRAHCRMVSELPLEPQITGVRISWKAKQSELWAKQSRQRMLWGREKMAHLVHCKNL